MQAILLRQPPGYDAGREVLFQGFGLLCASVDVCCGPELRKESLDQFVARVPLLCRRGVLFRKNSVDRVVPKQTNTTKLA